MTTTINAITSAGGGIALTGDSSGILDFQSAGSTKMVIDTSGNVGIGTTSPSAQLHQYLSSGTTWRYNSNGSVRVFEYASTTVAAGAYGTETNHPLLFATNNLQRMMITANGGVAFGSSGSAYGTSGQILQSNGDAAPTWVTPGMTLLGTITPTAVNSLSLGSLTLTGYKALFISFTSIAASALARNFISSTNVQSGGGTYINTTGTTISGMGLIDLATGALGGSLGENTYAGATSPYFVGGLTDVTTSSTIIYFRLNSTNTFAAQGSIKIYGVK